MPDAAADAEDRREQADPAGHLLARELVADDAEGEREDAAADALDEAGRDQHAAASWRQRRQQGAGGEDDQGPEQQPLLAVHVAEPAEDRGADRGGEQVAGEQPGDPGLGRVRGRAASSAAPAPPASSASRRRSRRARARRGSRSGACGPWTSSAEAAPRRYGTPLEQSQYSSGMTIPVTAQPCWSELDAEGKRATAAARRGGGVRRATDSTRRCPRSPPRRARAWAASTASSPPSAICSPRSWSSDSRKSSAGAERGAGERRRPVGGADRAALDARRAPGRR